MEENCSNKLKEQQEATGKRVWVSPEVADVGPLTSVVLQGGGKSPVPGGDPGESRKQKPDITGAPRGR